jgi:hypothetical protein
MNAAQEKLNMSLPNHQYETRLIDNQLLAWHFIREDMTTGKRQLDVFPGKTFRFRGRDVALCASGYHASVNPLHAYSYAPGDICCRVGLWGESISDDYKSVGRFRHTISWNRGMHSQTMNHLRQHFFINVVIPQIKAAYSFSPRLVHFSRDGRSTIPEAIEAAKAAYEAADYSPMAAFRDAFYTVMGTRFVFTVEPLWLAITMWPMQQYHDLHNLLVHGKVYDYSRHELIWFEEADYWTKILTESMEVENG